MRAPALALLIFAAAASCARAAWNPEGWSAPNPGISRAGPVNPASASLSLLLGFYRSQISPSLSASCPSYPSCSAYSLKAVEKHGPLLGSVLTASRLVSEADEGLFAPTVTFGRATKVWYPVEEPFILKDVPHGR